MHFRTIRCYYASQIVLHGHPTKMPKRKNSQPKPSVAPGQYLGYSVQATRFLHRLLKGDLEDLISLEVIDDVGVMTASGKVIAEQSKSVLDGNPVSDRSPQLWKTFSNWIRAVEDGSINPKTTEFVLYV